MLQKLCTNCHGGNKSVPDNLRDIREGAQWK